MDDVQCSTAAQIDLVGHEISSSLIQRRSFRLKGSLYLEGVYLWKF